MECSQQSRCVRSYCPSSRQMGPLSWCSWICSMETVWTLSFILLASELLAGSDRYLRFVWAWNLASVPTGSFSEPLWSFFTLIITDRKRIQNRTELQSNVESLNWGPESDLGDSVVLFLAVFLECRVKAVLVCTLECQEQPRRALQQTLLIRIGNRQEFLHKIVCTSFHWVGSRIFRLRNSALTASKPWLYCK